MDGETIRLIVVALGAIIAGIAGQLIAGAFNSRNTSATIEAARQAAEAQHEADRDIEHDRWLRDRKFAAYANFIGQVQELNVLVMDLHTDPDSDVSRLPELAKELFDDELLLLVPAHIKKAISPVWHGVSRMTALYQEMPAGEERMAAFNKATDQFNADFQKLSTLLRADLGIEESKE